MLRTDGIVEISDLPIICWRNLVTATNVQAESDPDFPVSNVANPLTSSKWKADASGSPLSSIEYLTIDISDNANYVAIAGHNLGSAGIAVGLEISTYNSPAGSAERVIDLAVPTDDSPLIFAFETELIEAIHLVFQYTGTTPAEIAVVYAGLFTELPEGIQGDHVPLPLAFVREVVNGRSENGAFLGRKIVAEGLQSTATIANLETDYVRDELMPFLEFAAEDPFFWIWSPETYPDETAFAWLENDAQPSFDIDGYASVDLQMRGLGS
jgi:hypothetical protein